MPFLNTITAFYNFQANTKARASQANINFTNFRGHYMPTSLTTASAANLTYQIGNFDCRWRYGYFAETTYRESNSSWRIYDEGIAGTPGDLVFTKDGTRIMTLTTKDHTATTAIAATVASSSLTPVIVAGSSLTMATNNRPVYARLTPVIGTSRSYLMIDPTGSGAVTGELWLYRNGTAVQGQTVGFLQDTTTSNNNYFPVSVIDFYDLNLTTGSNVYDLRMAISDTADKFYFTNAQLLCRRLR